MVIDKKFFPKLSGISVSGRKKFPEDRLIRHVERPNGLCTGHR
jgi:hypothetical protein